MRTIPHRTLLASLFAGGLLLAGVAAFTSRPGVQGATREFTITGDQFAFKPIRIEVQKDDLVKITFTAKDIAHSFTIDQYRIAKRAAAGWRGSLSFARSIADFGLVIADFVIADCRFGLTTADFD